MKTVQWILAGLMSDGKQKIMKEKFWVYTKICFHHLKQYLRRATLDLRLESFTTIIFWQRRNFIRNLRHSFCSSKSSFFENFFKISKIWILFLLSWDLPFEFLDFYILYTRGYKVVEAGMTFPIDLGGLVSSFNQNRVGTFDNV